MKHIIILSLEDLRKLQNGNVIKVECQGVNTFMVCTDNYKEAMDMVDMEIIKETLLKQEEVADDLKN